MIKPNLQTALLSCLLSFGLSVAAVMCLITGFDLAVDSLPRLFLICAGTALYGSVLFQLSNIFLSFCIISIPFCVCLWMLKIPVSQLTSLIHHIVQIYSQAYHWAAPSAPIPDHSFDFPMLVMGYWITCTVNFWFCRGKGVFCTLISIGFPLALSFVVTDTVPDVKYLFLILAGFAMIILTATVRKRNITQGNRLMLQAAFPVISFLMLLFLLSPQEDYVNRAEIHRSQLKQSMQTLAHQVENRLCTFESHAQDVNLASHTAASPSSLPVMTVNSPYTGTLYLRRQDYNRYTGSGWIADEQRKEVLGNPVPGEDTVTIRTRHLQESLYIPCMPAMAIPLVGGRAVNHAKLLEYQIPVVPPGSPQTSAEASVCDETAYLAIPKSAAVRAASILSDILPVSSSTEQIAAAIAGYVQSCAVYDLYFEKMPPEEPDFAMWFLEDAQRGSCVHFATSAAVLLRAAGIPARYVTGYMIRSSAGKSIPVTNKNAHAWVEFYNVHSNSWHILEATPPSPAPAFPESASRDAPVLPTTSDPGNTAVKTGLPLSFITLPAVFVLLLLFSVLQRRIRILLRRKHRRRLSARQQAMELWKEAELLSRLLKQPPTETILVLMQKALYSQHDLSETELQQIDSYLRTCRSQLQQKPHYIRLIHQYLYAVY